MGRGGRDGGRQGGARGSSATVRAKTTARVGWWAPGCTRCAPRHGTASGTLLSPPLLMPPCMPTRRHLPHSGQGSQQLPCGPQPLLPLATSHRLFPLPPGTHLLRLPNGLPGGPIPRWSLSQVASHLGHGVKALPCPPAVVEPVAPPDVGGQVPATAHHRNRAAHSTAWHTSRAVQHGQHVMPVGRVAPYREWDLEPHTPRHHHTEATAVHPSRRCTRTSAISCGRARPLMRAEGAPRAQGSGPCAVVGIEWVALQQLALPTSAAPSAAPCPRPNTSLHAPSATPPSRQPVPALLPLYPSPYPF